MSVVGERWSSAWTRRVGYGSEESVSFCMVDGIENPLIEGAGYLSAKDQRRCSIQG
jgi:hypothetical protein